MQLFTTFNEYYAKHGAQGHGLSLVTNRLLDKFSGDHMRRWGISTFTFAMHCKQLLYFVPLSNSGVGTWGAGGHWPPPMIQQGDLPPHNQAPCYSIHYTISCVYSGFVDFITHYYIMHFVRTASESTPTYW